MPFKGKRPEDVKNYEESLSVEKTEGSRVDRCAQDISLNKSEVFAFTP